MRKTIFSKYSNDRADQYKIRTDICLEENGDRVVTKNPLNEAAKQHVKNIYKSYQRLCKRYEGADISINTCSWKPDQAEFQYVEGKTLQEVLDELLDQGKKKEFFEELDRFIWIVNYGSDIKEFHSGAQFESVFGKIDLPRGLLANQVSNVDILFENIIISDTWTMIDYEWTFDFPVPNKYIIYRALSAYVNGLYEAASDKGLDGIDLFEYCGISKEEKEIFRKMGENFAAYVLKGNHIMNDLYGMIHQPVINVKDMLNRLKKRSEQLGVQVFFDTGKGFQEEGSRFISFPYKIEDEFHLQLALPEKCRAVRIDPAMDYCLMQISQVLADGEKCDYSTNGFEVDQQVVVFNTGDSQLYIQNLENKQNVTVLGQILLANEAICKGIYDYSVKTAEKLTEANQEINRLNPEINRLNPEITRLNQVILGQNQKIAELYQEVGKRDDRITEQKQELESLHDERKMKQELENRNQMLEDEIDRMKNTKAWKAYEKYRNLVKKG